MRPSAPAMVVGALPSPLPEAAVSGSASAGTAAAAAGPEAAATSGSAVDAKKEKQDDAEKEKEADQARPGSSFLQPQAHGTSYRRDRVISRLAVNN